MADNIYICSEISYYEQIRFLWLFGDDLCCIMLSYIYLIRVMEAGQTMWLIVSCSWGCDTFAYLVGMTSETQTGTGSKFEKIYRRCNRVGWWLQLDWLYFMPIFLLTVCNIEYPLLYVG
jgi:hypothetical protein